MVLTTLNQCFSSPNKDANACAKRAKISAAATALASISEGGLGYTRVILVDDTILVRKDAPDVFDLVPPGSLGASVEDWRVRDDEETALLMRLSLVKYSDADNLLLSASLTKEYDQILLQTVASDARWFNSGFIVLSQAHSNLLNVQDFDSLDFVVLWDQGLLNARRRFLDIDLHDLGHDFNWVGSFNGSNAHKRPFEAHEAFVVHATTGLPQFGAARKDFLEYVDWIWSDLGK